MTDNTKWYHEHREEVLLKRKIYREQNREKIRAQHKTEYERHKESYLKRAQKRAKEKPQEIREYQRKWDRDKYAESVKTLDTSMYQFDDDVTIVSSKAVEYKGRTYFIGRNGYLKGGTNIELHVSIAKDMGIWFEGCNVHHIDGDNKNNKRSNLIALTVSEHLEAHRKMKDDYTNYLYWINTRSDKEDELWPHS